MNPACSAGGISVLWAGSHGMFLLVLHAGSSHWEYRLMMEMIGNACGPWNILDQGRWNMHV